MHRIHPRAAEAVYKSVGGRAFSSTSAPSAPRHLMSMGDVTASELTSLVRNAANHKAAVKAAFNANQAPSGLIGSLTGKTIAMMFNKRSTRTRVSTEAAVAMMGGHAMFLGKDDIQLGVRGRVMFSIGPSCTDNTHR